MGAAVDHAAGIGSTSSSPTPITRSARSSSGRSSAALVNGPAHSAAVAGTVPVAW